MSNPLPTLLTPDEKNRWNEMLKISHLVIVLLYLRTCDPRPITQFELADVFQIDRKSAAKYMRQLSARHFITQVSKRDGYALAEGSHTFFEMWGKNGHISLKESFNNDLKTLKIKKEGKKEVGKFWTHARTLSIEQIVAETPKLFEKPVTLFGIQNSDPLMTLAVLAHAYDQRDALKVPAVFAYRRLQRGQLPDKRYLANPEAYLPNDFLHALGLQELKIVEVEPASDPAGNGSADEEPSLPQADATVTERISEAWKSVVAELKDQMPRAGFDVYVRNTIAVHFEQNELHVGAESGSAREWLESRLQSTVERLLVGILNREVQVRFVAVETEPIHASA